MCINKHVLCVLLYVVIWHERTNKKTHGSNGQLIVIILYVTAKLTWR